MKKNFTLSNLEGLVTVIFLLIIQNYVSDHGMGFLGAAFCFVAFVATVLTGGMRETVEKMISIRMHRGMHGNTKKAFKNCIMYTVFAGLLLNSIVWLFGDAISAALFHSNYPAVIMKLLAVSFSVRGFIKVISGFYMGIGNSSAANLASVIYCVTLLANFPFTIYFVKSYGEKVTALLNNQMFVPLYMVIGAAFSLIFASILTLLFLAIVYRRVTDHVNQNENERGMKRHDSEKRFIRAMTGLRIKICYQNVFVCIGGLILCVLYMSKEGKTVLETAKITETAFSGLGIIVAKCILPIIFSLYIFKEYIAKEKYMLHVDYTKEEKRNIVLRSQYMLKNAGFLLLPIVVILMVCTEPFLRILYSGEVIGAMDIFRLCAPLMFLLGVCIVLMGIVSTLGEKRSSVIISAVAFFVFIIFATLFHNGAKDVFMAIYVFAFIHIAGHLVWMQRIIRMDWIDVGVKYLKILLSCLAVAILELILNHFVTMNPFLFVLSIILGYFVFYVVMVLIRGISKKDAASLKGTFSYIPVSFISNKLGMW